jgi:nucleotide-binding universal stress UspA family protein
MMKDGRKRADMNRRILVPLDGSQLAEQVLLHLKALVECQGAEIHLLSVAPVIDNVATIELIAMCTHGWSGLARWAYGSVADRVLRASSCPVLLVRAIIE